MITRTLQLDRETSRARRHELSTPSYAPASPHYHSEMSNSYRCLFLHIFTRSAHTTSNTSETSWCWENIIFIFFSLEEKLAKHLPLTRVRARITRRLGWTASQKSFVILHATPHVRVLPLFSAPAHPECSYRRLSYPTHNARTPIHGPEQRTNRPSPPHPHENAVSQCGINSLQQHRRIHHQ